MNRTLILAVLVAACTVGCAKPPVTRYDYGNIHLEVSARLKYLDKVLGLTKHRFRSQYPKHLQRSGNKNSNR